MQRTLPKIQLLFIISAHLSVYQLANGFLTARGVFSPTVRNTRVFVPNAAPNSLKSKSSPRLMGSFQDEEDEDDDYIESSSQASPETMENARQQFEQMFSIPNDNKEANNDVELSTSSSMNEHERFELSTKTIHKAVLSNRDSPPPLTAILRERRLEEIQLLSTLAFSDEATNQLWALWIGERGPESASNLLHAEGLMAVESWNEAELVLLSLIEEHGIHWAEPVNRLATLYYMGGRYDESKALCELVLDVKPWHFGALSGIVMVCTAQNDATGARFWSEKRLPPVGDRRKKWTEEFTLEAHHSLEKASLVGRNREIGKEEVEFRSVRAQLEETVRHNDRGEIDPSDESDFDAWQ